MKKHKKFLILVCTFIMVTAFSSVATFATGVSPTPVPAIGDVAGAIQSTWAATLTQIKTVVNTVIFPCIDLILAVFFFAKIGMSYFDYRKQGQFDWVSPAILFACLVFTLTAPLYIWGVIGL